MVPHRLQALVRRRVHVVRPRGGGLHEHGFGHFPRARANQNPRVHALALVLRVKTRFLHCRVNRGDRSCRRGVGFGARARGTHVRGLGFVPLHFLTLHFLPGFALVVRLRDSLQSVLLMGIRGGGNGVAVFAVGIFGGTLGANGSGFGFGALLSRTRRGGSVGRSRGRLRFKRVRGGSLCHRLLHPLFPLQFLQNPHRFLGLFRLRARVFRIREFQTRRQVDELFHLVLALLLLRNGRVRFRIRRLDSLCFLQLEHRARLPGLVAMRDSLRGVPYAYVRVEPDAGEERAKRGGEVKTIAGLPLHHRVRRREGFGKQEGRLQLFVLQVVRHELATRG
mmetsp:Transcript_15333/g.50334  ORF Transcript_15333/g.50334 Transcript_15333/m.50334 type:complete len:336 (+) Transcript_15333:3141-4148(+)